MTTTTRRQFLLRSLHGAAGAMLAPGLLSACATGAGAGGRRYAIQVYAVNQAFESDPVGTFQTLARIGYTDVELYAGGDRTPAEYRRMIDDAGLVCPSVHLDFKPDNLQAAFDHANTLGAKYATAPSLRGAVAPGTKWNAPFSADECRRTIDLSNRIGQEARKAGLQYAYHNHAYEFEDVGEGSSGYDLMLRETDKDLVKYEIDCGWMTFAGRRPEDYLAADPSRFPMLHIKNYLQPVTGADGRPEMRGAELGSGVVDYDAIFAAARRAGVQHYFAEQEGPFDRMTQLEAAAVAFDFLRKMG
jgi:sugar phosphate isomerase/epimerase